MKVTIERKALVAALGSISLCVDKKHNILVLRNVLLNVSAAALCLRGTDMDTQIECRVATDLGEPGESGAVTVNADALLKTIKAFDPGALVELSENTSNERTSLLVRSGTTSYALPTLPASHFPDCPPKTTSVEFVITGADWRQLYDATAFAISSEETRYYLNGIYLHAASSDGVSVLRAVATDGYRMALAELPLPSGVSALAGHILPREPLGVLRKLLAKYQGNIVVRLADSRTEWLFGDTRVEMKSVGGNFPDYARSVPGTNPHHVTVNVARTREAIKHVMAIAGSGQRHVKLTIADGIVLEHRSPVNGTATSEIECIRNDAGCIEIGFVADQLDSILARCGDFAALEIDTPAGPITIRDPAVGTRLFVLMPARA